MPWFAAHIRQGGPLQRPAGICGIARAVCSQPRDERPDVRPPRGRVISHPHAIKVEARAGRVILSGPILAAEEHRLVQAVRAVKGVSELETRFDRYQQAANIPSLQGGASRRPPPTRLDVLQENWAPATRAIMGMSGSALAAAGVARRGVSGLVMAATGAALAARAFTNVPFRRLAGSVQVVTRSTCRRHSRSTCRSIMYLLSGTTSATFRNSCIIYARSGPPKIRVSGTGRYQGQVRRHRSSSMPSSLSESPIVCSPGKQSRAAPWDMQD